MQKTTPLTCSKTFITIGYSLNTFHAMEKGVINSPQSQSQMQSMQYNDYAMG